MFFVSLSVKAVHLELVSDLTTESFIACLHHFIARVTMDRTLWELQNTSRNEFMKKKESEDILQFLLKSEHCVGIYPRESSAFWWFMGSYSKDFQKASILCCW